MEGDFEIDQEMKAEMIGRLRSPAEVLSSRYRNAVLPGFEPGIVYLSSVYNLRETAKDGNCFYRAFLFSYLEQLVIGTSSQDSEIKRESKQELKRIIKVIEASKIDLITQGYSEISIESFHEMFLEHVND